jgi:site-specific DNA-methyltransferase (adenine-specific)
VSFEKNRVAVGDCIAEMRKLPDGCVDLAFADPPFNIGYKYDKYRDRLHDDRYLNWSKDWGREVVRILKPNGTFWLAIGDEYVAELKCIFHRELGLSCVNWVIWYYTFGVHCTRKFARSHTHLLYFAKNPNDYTFNDSEIRVPSARATTYADPRADPRGRIPDNTWILPAQDFILRPQDAPHTFNPLENTWYYSRVAGTFGERRGFHGCQMPEQVLGRIVKLSSNPGDLVLDPFAGSGTTLAVAKKLGRSYLGYDLSANYVAQVETRLADISAGDPLLGPADPLSSAPSTARGRKLPEERKRPLESVRAVGRKRKAP